MIIIQNVLLYAPPDFSIKALEIIGPMIAAGIREKLAILKLTAKFLGPNLSRITADASVGVPP